MKLIEADFEQGRKRNQPLLPKIKTKEKQENFRNRKLSKKREYPQDTTKV